MIIYSEKQEAIASLLDGAIPKARKETVIQTRKPPGREGLNQTWE